MDTSYPRDDIFMTHPNKPDNAHTVVDIGAPTAPRDHLLWSLCNTVYLNLFCLGFMALVYSVKVRENEATLIMGYGGGHWYNLEQVNSVWSRYALL